MISKHLIQTCKKSIKNHIKTLVFTTLNILQLKKNYDYENIYSVNLLYFTITHASGYIEEKGINKYLVLIQQMKIKSYLKNIMMFLMELETKSKK